MAEACLTKIHIRSDKCLQETGDVGLTPDSTVPGHKCLHVSLPVYSPIFWTLTNYWT